MGSVSVAGTWPGRQAAEVARGQEDRCQLWCQAGPVRTGGWCGGKPRAARSDLRRAAGLAAAGSRADLCSLGPQAPQGPRRRAPPGPGPRLPPEAPFLLTGFGGSQVG